MMASTQIEITSTNNSDRTVGIVIGVIVSLIVILLVVVIICSDSTIKVNMTQPIKQGAGPQKPVLKQPEQKAPVPAPVQGRPNIPQLINRIMHTRRMQPMGNPFHNNFVAAQILNTLQVANHFGELTDRRLPVVIDLAVAIPNGDPFADRKLQEILMESANQTRDKIIGNRRAIARTEPTPVARMDRYIKLSSVISDDDQTSHDTYVNKCLRNIIDILREDQKETPLLSIFQIRSEIQRQYNIDPPKEQQTLDTPKEQSVLTVIDVMNNDGKPQYNSTLQATEAEILQRTWMRTLDPRNEKNRRNMQDMIYMALGSCYEGGNIVCINGRDAKVLSAIVMLDFDERTHELQTLEIHKNNIFIKTRELVIAASKKALTSSDPKVVAVAKSYLVDDPKDLPENLDETAANNFTAYLRKEIKKMVEIASKGLPDEIVKHIVTDAIAAV